MDLESFLLLLLQWSLSLKEVDFGLQKPTGPSSGVVASIALVSPGVSLAEVCATCLMCHLVIKVQYLELDLLNFFFQKKNCYLMFNTQFLYQQETHFIL